jgi:hypothetical protein
VGWRGARSVRVLDCRILSCEGTTAKRNGARTFIVILIDDLRYDEFGAGGIPT